MSAILSLLSCQAQAAKGISIRNNSPSTGAQVNVVQGNHNKVSDHQTPPSVNCILPEQGGSSTSSQINTIKSFDMPIKVQNSKKRESIVTYMLHIPKTLSELDCLRDLIREQVGWDKVSKLHNFGVGYISGSHKISFTDLDNLQAELQQLCTKKGFMV